MLYLRRNNLTMRSLPPWHLHKMMALSSQWCSSHHTQDQRAIMLWACLKLLNAFKDCFHSLHFSRVFAIGECQSFHCTWAVISPKQYSVQVTAVLFNFLRFSSYVTHNIPWSWKMWSLILRHWSSLGSCQLSPADSLGEKWLLPPSSTCCMWEKWPEQLECGGSRTQRHARVCVNLRERYKDEEEEKRWDINLNFLQSYSTRNWTLIARVLVHWNAVLQL